MNAATFHDRVVTMPLDLCRRIMAGVYFWAGVAKLNHNFFAYVGPWMTGNLPCLKWTYLLLPYAEITAGLLLATPGRFARWTGRILILGISIGALVSLVPMGWNTVVWPWQITNVTLVWLATAPRSVSEDPSLPSRWRGYSAGFLAVVMPSLVFVGLWPEYFSWRVYDGRNRVPQWLESRATGELNVPVPPDPSLLRRLSRR